MNAQHEPEPASATSIATGNHDTTRSNSRDSPLGSGSEEASPSAPLSTDRHLLRFFVSERKQFGRDSARILEICNNGALVWVRKAKSCKVVQEIPAIGFSTFEGNGSATVSATKAGKSSKFVFSSNDDKIRFLGLLDRRKTIFPGISRAKSWFAVDPVKSVSLLHGETIVYDFTSINAACALSPDVYKANVIFTDYRMMLMPTSSEPDGSFKSFFFLDVPFASVLEASHRKDPPLLCMVVKDGRRINLDLSDLYESQRETMYKYLYERAFPVHIRSSFAVKYFESLSNLYSRQPELRRSLLQFQPDLIDEYKRLGLTNDSSLWRTTMINAESFEVCASYPRVLVVPKDASDDLLRKSAMFRSNGRFPVACWANHHNCCIARSSQPRPGITGNRSSSDESLIDMFRKIDHRAEAFLIVDARAKINAVGNSIKGKGYESSAFYDNCTVLFMGMVNIHLVRDSFNQLTEQCQNLDDERWLQRLDATKWLQHIQRLLATSYRVAEAIYKDHVSVLIHCSDGWDRTSQVSSTAQILLDHYYRTYDGFMVLIDKEWLQFGHRFATRNNGIGKNASVSSRSKMEFCPIFVQWLDAVHQLLLQFPNAFEFNCAMLVFLADHCVSDRFGTFLFDSELERFENGLQFPTVSIWSHLREHASEFKNLTYRPENEPLRPNTSIRCIRLWDAYFCRWELVSPNKPSENSAESEQFCNEIIALRRQVEIDTNVIQEQEHTISELEEAVRNLYAELKRRLESTSMSPTDTVNELERVRQLLPVNVSTPRE